MHHLYRKTNNVTMPGELSLDLNISDTDSKHLGPIIRENFLQLNKKTNL